MNLMATNYQHMGSADQQTISAIEKFGLSVIIIESTDYLPEWIRSRVE